MTEVKWESPFDRDYDSFYIEGAGNEWIQPLSSKTKRVIRQDNGTIELKEGELKIEGLIWTPSFTEKELNYLNKRDVNPHSPYKFLDERDGKKYYI